MKILPQVTLRKLHVYTSTWAFRVFNDRLCFEVYVCSPWWDLGIEYTDEEKWTRLTLWIPFGHINFVVSHERSLKSYIIYLTYELSRLRYRIIGWLIKPLKRFNIYQCEECGYPYRTRFRHLWHLCHKCVNRELGGMNE